MLAFREKLQLVLMFVVMTGNTLYMIGPLYFIYLDSWIKESNPQFSYSLLFMMFNFIDIGIPTLNWVSHKLIPLIGTKTLIILGGPMFVLSCVSFYFSAHILILMAANLLAGMTHQLFVVATMEILTKKYPGHYMGYVGKVFSAYSLTGSVWTVLNLLIVNPTNHPTTRVSIIDGHAEYYYSQMVTERFPYMLWAMMGYGIFTTSFLGLFLSDPTFTKSVMYRKIFGDTNNTENKHSVLLQMEVSGEQDTQKWFRGFKSFYCVRNNEVKDHNLGKHTRVRFYSLQTHDLEQTIPLKELDKVRFEKYINTWICRILVIQTTLWRPNSRVSCQ